MEDLDLSSDDEYDGDDLYDVFSPQEIEASQLVPTGPAINIGNDDPSEFVFATQASLEEELEQASSPIREEPSVRYRSKMSGHTSTRKDPPLFSSPMRADFQSVSGSSKAGSRSISQPDAPLSGTNAPGPPSSCHKPPTFVTRRLTPPSPSRHPYKQADAYSTASSKMKPADRTSPSRRRSPALNTGLNIRDGRTTEGTAQSCGKMVIDMSIDRSSISEPEGGPSSTPAQEKPDLPPTEAQKPPLRPSEISLSLEQTKVLEIVLAG
jgi:hypothetical protein